VFCTDYQSTGADPASKGRGAVSVIFGSQVSLRVHYCERDEVHFTTLLWQNNERQNGLKSRMLFSELHKIMAKKVTFIGFRGRGRPNRSPWIRPCQSTQWNAFDTCAELSAAESEYQHVRLFGFFRNLLKDWMQAKIKV